MANTQNSVSKLFTTSSSYEGDWNTCDDKMEGFGLYRFASGCEYVGHFRGGKFHGSGTLQMPNGATFTGQWEQNQMVNFKLTFADGLEFAPRNWEYLRRLLNQPYRKCKEMAGNNGYLNVELRQDIPPDGYDTIDGIYLPEKKYIVDYEDRKKIIRIPTIKEADWIVKHCRRGVYVDPVAESLMEYI